MRGELNSFGFLCSLLPWWDIASLRDSFSGPHDGHGGTSWDTGLCKTPSWPKGLQSIQWVACNCSCDPCSFSLLGPGPWQYLVDCFSSCWNWLFYPALSLILHLRPFLRSVAGLFLHSSWVWVGGLGGYPSSFPLGVLISFSFGFCL